MKTLKAKKYYCAYLKSSDTFELTRAELLEIIAQHLKEPKRKEYVIWITREKTSPYEELHQFGVKVSNKDFVKFRETLTLNGKSDLGLPLVIENDDAYALRD